MRQAILLSIQKEKSSAAAELGRVEHAWKRDSSHLAANHLLIDIILQQPGFVRARVKNGDGANEVIIDWAWQPTKPSPWPDDLKSETGLT